MVQKFGNNPVLQKENPMNSELNKQKTVIRYSKKNLPPSIEVALEAIDGLDDNVVRMQTKLDHTDSIDFSDDEKYKKWRQSAISALSYTKQELFFLNKWIESERKTASHPNNTDFKLVSQEVRDLALELANQIGGSYNFVYTADFLPESLDTAQERMTYLTGMKQKLQNAFSHVTAAWSSHALRRSDLPGVKSPLQAISSNVEIEMRVVKDYIRINSTNLNRVVVCVTALNRAVTEGFIPTMEEQSVLIQLNKYLSLD